MHQNVRKGMKIAFFHSTLQGDPYVPTSRGFTLIELMIVIAIIAILSAIAITVYQDSTAKAQLSEAFSLGDGLKTSVAEYRHQTGACPAPGTGGIASPASYSGKYVASVTAGVQGANCTLTVQLRSNTIAPPLRGKQVVFRMDPQASTAQWSCTSNVGAVYLPQTCR